jgi:restriction endonuclease S subunit
MPKLHIDNEDKLNLLPETFYITYYAKKHSKIITRKGLKFKPNTDTQGKYFVSKNETPCFIYWDCDAPANENGNQWRQATGLITVQNA